MKKAFIILAALTFFYPFGCEAQQCDTVYIESPAWDKERNQFIATIQRLTAENISLREDVDALSKQIDDLRANENTLNNTIALQASEINSLNGQIAILEAKLSEKADTIIKEVVPAPMVDEVVVTHCDSTKFTTWFHHGGISGYPHDISFATSEYGFVRVTFKDSLTDEIKVKQSYRLKRTRNYAEARTYYEFIE